VPIGLVSRKDSADQWASFDSPEAATARNYPLLTDISATIPAPHPRVTEVGSVECWPIPLAGATTRSGQRFSIADIEAAHALFASGAVEKSLRNFES
jgi:hypothetical protein